jgi:TPR repeat protein
MTFLFRDTIRYYGAVLGFEGFEYRYARWLARRNGTSDWEMSAHYLKQSASKNYSLAQYELSRYLSSGSGVPQDPVESLRYLKLAVDQGLAAAQYDYGLKLLRGEGLRVDEVAAAGYLDKAASQGHRRATYEFGKCLNAGVGVVQNRDKAVRLFKIVAYHGVSDAQLAYALHLLDGGKLVEGAKWAESGALRENSGAEFLFGKCLRDGIGVVRNLEAAAVYLKRAADRGNVDAQRAYAALSNPGTVLNIGKYIIKDTVTEGVPIHLGRSRMRLILILTYWIG